MAAMLKKLLDIKCVSDINEAKSVWMKLSPDINIYDNWDFRYCFYKYFNYPLYFYAGFDRGEIVGLLPLQYNKDVRHLEFFGGSFMEDNRVFIKPGYEECIPQFYNSIKEPARLEDIIREDPFTKSLDVLEYKYVADISEMRSANDYLIKKFRAKSRNRLRKKIRLIEKMKPEIIVNNYGDIDILIELNKKTFGKESSFNKPFRSEIFHDLLKMNYEFHMLSFVVNGKKEAVSLSVRYKDVFVNLNMGVNKKSAPNLSAYVIFKKLEKAIACGAKILDAGVESFGWKKHWHLEKIPQRIFVRE